MSACGDGIIRIWDVKSGQKVRQFRGDSTCVSNVKVSADSRSVLFGGMDKILRLQDFQTGKEIRDYQGHTNVINGVAFSPDGRRLLSASADKTIRLWDLSSGQELHRFEGHTAHIWDIAFCLDGNYAVSASGDKTVRLWRLPPGDTVASKPAEPKPELTPDPKPGKSPVPDDVPHALRFKDKAYVELKDTKGLLNLNGAFTVESWVRWPKTAPPIINLMGDEAWESMNPEIQVPVNCGWVLRTTAGANGMRGLEVGFGATIAGKSDWFGAKGPPRPDSEKWQHVAICKTPDVIRIFWNGKLYASQTCRGVRFNNCPTELYLGVRKSPFVDRQFHGDVQAFRLSSVTRYQGNFVPAETFAKDASTLVLLDFAAGKGSEIPDLSGKGHHGLVVGAEWVESGKMK